MTAAPVIARSLKIAIRVVNGSEQGKTWSFEKPIVSIGRGSENDMVFANDPKMSRNHAELRAQNGQLYIRNLSQKNFILVNGEKVEEKLITGQVEIFIGETTIQVKVEQPLVVPPTQPLFPIQQNPQAMVQNNLATTGQKQFQPVGIEFSKPSAWDPQVSPKDSVKNAPPRQRPPPSMSTDNDLLSNPRVRFYAIIAVVGILTAWLVLDGGSKKKEEVHLRTEGDVARAIEESANAVRELKKQQEITGQDSIQYKSAQEHYIKGFRDYRQGQYARAMQSFQAALSFYPAHELARKYYLQSQRKFDEMVDQSMSLGRKYYQKQNFRMCQSSFANVMIMLKDPTKPKYKEAKQRYEECSLRTEGKF